MTPNLRPRRARPARARVSPMTTLAALATLAAVASAVAPARPAWADGDDDAAKAWNVESTWGPTHDVAIDVQEGTWLSVDVHPSGEVLVFDLLGDLYELPITGGEARKLTDGAAWDFAPRYSPDGKWLAFVSDRGGGDNLWRMPARGGDATAITKESFRLVSSPVWTPDSRFVAGRKHFTSGRSLGAGEIWFYHADGVGTGLQATVKPTEQKDFGEPALSPDGRWLYVSLDATPGPHFEYNKDSNAGIYAILRIDRADGRSERLIGGPGGAIRPTPSPDGKRLAWIRRVRGKTTLMLRTLADGSDVVLDDGLDRDLQETWAIHGVYPHFAFLPDSSGVVYWAAGKIWRLDLAAATAAHAAGKPVPRQEIHFHVRDRRRVHEALRQPVTLGKPQFDVRAVRWASEAPDGSAIVFEALGQLWLQPKGGPRRRLPTPAETLALMPSWARDSASIVYSTWHDDQGGQVRRIDARKGRDAALVASPGHHLEPVLSPDGRAVVWRRGEGGWLRTRRWSVDTGIWVAPVAGGPPALVTRDGESPHFGPEPDRVYLQRRGKEAALELWSVELGGRDERPLVRIAMGQDLRIAPDGGHVAWREGYHVYVAPHTAVARTIELAADSKALPIKRVSTDGGEFLSFASASRLQWSLGPELLAVDPAAPATPTSVALGWSETSAQTTGVAAIVGARLLTMRDDLGQGGVIEDGTVVWRDDRIVAVGPRASVSVPAGAKIFDGTGKTVLPGLVDVHAHGAQATDEIVPQQSWLDLSMLSFGVTSIHDPSNDTSSFFAAAERQKRGTLVAPRLMSTGTIVYGAKAPGFFAPIASQEDAAHHLRRLAASGAFSAKSYNQPRRDQRQQVLAAARALKMMVVPEGGALFHHNMTHVVDGHTGVEHALPLARLYKDVRTLWAGTRVGHTPTLGVAYGGLGGENYWYAHMRVDQHERLGHFVPKFALDGRARRPGQAPDEEWNHIAAARFATELLRAGGMVQLGAHGQREGLAAHWELWSFVQGGMTPLEALRVGTLGGARYLGLDGSIGSLQAGKLADLMVVDGAPDKDIRVSDHVAWTVLGGKVFDAATMAEAWPKAGPPPQFWWQQPGNAGPGRRGMSATCGCGAHAP